MKIVELNGNGKARDAVIELCQGIETIFNPLRMLLTSDGGETPDCLDLRICIEKLTHVIDPDYEELEKELAKEGGRSDTLIDMQVIERDACFAAGCLFGMKAAGQPAEEIRKMGISLVTRKSKFEEPTER